jgi:cytochrome c biogenesis protein CcmG/thiol:disulfide interchange protein DsbE
VTRRQVIGFVVVLVLIGAGLLARSRGDDPAASDRPGLRELRATAALEPCPQGLGTGLPDLRLPCLGGGPAVSLRQPGPGTPLLVNLWATWCGPCVREVPTLVAFGKKAAGRVAIVGIDTTDEPEDALTFAAQYAMRYPSLVDPDGRVLRAYGGGPPVTLLVDPDGRVRFAHRGELRSVAQVEKLVADHLGVTL